MASFQNTRARLYFVNKGKLAYTTGDQNNREWHTEDNWMGFLTNITFKYIDPKPEKGLDGYEALNIHLNDGNEQAILTCKFNSGYGRAFAKIIGNADLTQQIGVIPTYKEEGANKIGGMMIQQNGTMLKWMWTKDNPGVCPQPVEHEINGKKLVDYKEQMIFLKDYLLNVIVPSLQPAPVAPHPLMQGTSDIQQAGDKMAETNRSFTPPAQDVDPDGIADDLPF